MDELKTYSLVDALSGDEVCVVVRYSPGSVAVALSQANSGDIEVTFSASELDKFIEVLTVAKNKA